MQDFSLKKIVRENISDVQCLLWPDSQNCGGHGGGCSDVAGNQGERIDPLDKQIAGCLKMRLDGSSHELRPQSAEYRRAM